MRAKFPKDMFYGVAPPLVFRHQLYATLPEENRTHIDRRLVSFGLRSLVHCERSA